MFFEMVRADHGWTPRFSLLNPGEQLAAHSSVEQLELFA